MTRKEWESNDDSDETENLTSAELIPLVGTEDGGAIVAAVKDEKVVGMGKVRPAKEGQALGPDADYYVRCEKGRVVDAVKLAGGDGKPAQVATPAYRDNFDRIFGGKVERGQA